MVGGGSALSDLTCLIYMLGYSEHSPPSEMVGGNR